MTSVSPREARVRALLGQEGFAFLEQEFSLDVFNRVYSEIQSNEKPAPAATRYRDNLRDVVWMSKIQLQEQTSVKMAISISLAREISQFTQDREKISYYQFKFFEDSHMLLGEYANYLAGAKSHLSIYVRIKEHWPNSGTVQDAKIGRYPQKRWGYSDSECRIEGLVTSFFELMPQSS